MKTRCWVSGENTPSLSLTQSYPALIVPNTHTHLAEWNFYGNVRKRRCHVDGNRTVKEVKGVTHVLYLVKLHLINFISIRNC